MVATHCTIERPPVPRKPAGALAEWAGGRGAGLLLRDEHIPMCLADAFGKQGPTFRARPWPEAQRKPLVLPAPWAHTSFEPEQSFHCVVTVAGNCSWVASNSPKGSHQLNKWRVAGLSRWAAGLSLDIGTTVVAGVVGAGTEGPGEEGKIKGRGSRMDGELLLYGH